MSKKGVSNKIVCSSYSTSESATGVQVFACDASRMSACGDGDICFV